MTKAARLKRLLNPARVAWFGGESLTPAINTMRANGFTGDAVAVNPRRAEIAGLKCVSSVADLPWTPDVAVLVIPQAAIAATVHLLSERGCGGVVCIASGFSESAAGDKRQAELIAAAGNMPVLGPNCPGFGNFLDGAVLMMNHFGKHKPAAGVAVISSGGAYLSDLGCADRSLPIAYLIGAGNQAIVSVADMMDGVLDDPRVTAVNVYLESSRDGAGLSRAAAKAARLRKPVVAVNGGRSIAGARAAQSHTAALATDADIASALFDRFGWLEARTTTEAIETLKMLTLTAVPRGGRTGLITSSGSYAVLGADLADREGLKLPPPGNLKALRGLLPAYVTAGNPLDIADAQGLPMKKQREIFRAFLQNRYDLILQVMCYPPADGWDSKWWDSAVEALAQAHNGAAVAFINTLPESLPPAVRARLVKSGMAPLQGLEDGIRAAAHAVRYGKRRKKPKQMLLPQAEWPRQPSRRLNELRAKELLRAAGVETPSSWPLKRLPAADIIYPVVLKAVTTLAHKTEAGAVCTNIGDKRQLSAALSAMRKRLAATRVQSDGFFAEEMIRPAKAELLAGVRRVAGIGLVLTVAAGGDAAELLGDAKTVILPAPLSDIKKALRGLRLFPLIGGGWRGRERIDLAPALDALRRIIALMRASPAIVELEVNPLIITATRAVAADATARVIEAAAE